MGSLPCRYLHCGLLTLDIETAPEIIEALKKRLDHKVFGYTIPYDSVFGAVIQYLERAHSYSTNREWISFLLA